MLERKKKLIEVGLPLETINRESAREKSIRHGHPSTLHLWWSRKPTATARAVLFAQLVDDPSAHPELFPTQEAQDAERARLHELIEAMVVWENTAPEAQGIPLPTQGRTVSGRELFAMARDEIAKSNNGKLPAILDPFAGGGTIPLEAQRLGLEAHASDLNPVAVLINKALVEIPPKFAGRPPVHPDAPPRIGGWPRATGLAEDIRYYGQWMRDEAFKRIGHLYPKVKDADGVERTVIAWKWARTVVCPNPACRASVPTVSSMYLSKRPGRSVFLVPRVAGGGVVFSISQSGVPPESNKVGQGGRFRCWVCGAAISAEETHSQLDVPDPPVPSMIAVIAEGQRGHVYLDPSREQEAAAAVTASIDVDALRSKGPLAAESRGTFASNAQGRRYGFFGFADYFEDRQLIAMSTLSELVSSVHDIALADAMAVGIDEGCSLEDGGSGAIAYADSLSLYMAFVVSRMADKQSSLVGWDSSRDTISHVFTRQGIPMLWDYAEGNPFSGSGGNISGQADWIARVIERLPASGAGEVLGANASARPYVGLVVSTDPPYYDNVGYADLADFFYVWMRRSLSRYFPNVVSTVLTPKAEELLADPSRHGGSDGAERFFVDGFNQVFSRIQRAAVTGTPMTVYYAYKQRDADPQGSVTSTGWTTLLDGLTSSGWEIAATWPVRSELSNRAGAMGANSLASSIVLACRPRPEDAPTTTRRQFLGLLRTELPSALRAMMQGAVAPVDLAQAAIGPGMSIFSRYSKVREADGSDMSVRDALTLINATVDEVLDEQEGDFDADTRFAVKWYRTYGWTTESSGAADTLSRATGTSPAALERGGIFEAKGGKARLISPTELESAWDPAKDDRVSVWESTVRLAVIMGKQGQDQVATLLPAVESRVALDQVKELGFLLFHEAERKANAQDALLFNGLVSAWNAIGDQARRMERILPLSTQATLDFGDQE